MVNSIFSTRFRRPAFVAVCAGALALFSTGASTQGPRFYPDDPITRAPESQDASKAAPYDPSQMYELRVQPLRELQAQSERPAREEHKYD